MPLLNTSLPLWKYQSVGWSIWGVILWIYIDKVVPEAFSGLADWATLFVIHILTANLVAFWVGPRVISAIHTQRMWLAAGYCLLLATVIFTISVLLSMVAGAMYVRPIHSGAQVINWWQVVIVLYAGILPGIGYFAILWMRQLLRLDRPMFDALQSHVHQAVGSEMRGNLQVQLIPHLFNNLMGTLHKVVVWQPNKARYIVQLIMEFSKSYSRYITQKLMPLNLELELADLYIHMMEYHLGYKPHIDVVVDGDTATCKCVPMMLVLLIENMKKYAVLSNPAHPAVISIRIDGKKLHVKATNTKNHQMDSGSTGIGLDNLQKRLHLLWGNSAHVEIEGMDEGSNRFHVRIACLTALIP